MRNILLFLMLTISPATQPDSLLFTNSGLKEPTGQGTGLGLSLAYDIVKAHGGEIKVETKIGEARPDDTVGRGTEFICEIPIKTN